MDSTWIANFRHLHAQAKARALPGAHRAEYVRSREEFAHVVTTSQNLAVQAGKCHRRGFRVSRALQVDLDIAGRFGRAVTIDLSTRGFSAFVAPELAIGDIAAVKLRVPGGVRVKAEARVTNLRVQGATARASFHLSNIDPEDTERLEVFIFDVVLESIGEQREDGGRERGPPSRPGR